MHVCTKKGKGYGPAEENPAQFHGCGPFDPATGAMKSSGASAGEIVAGQLSDMADINIRIAAITAAMRHGTGLNVFAERHPDRFFDVGIAEEHAVTMAGGMAARGMHPYVAIYSTFLQRAYDQIMMDLCIDAQPVTLLVDRSGLTVVTNNIEIMMLLANSKNRILSSGGFLSSENRNCLIGSDAQRTFETVYADAAFFSVKALSGEGVVADCSREEVAVRDAMLKNAARKVLLCDSSKFGGRAPFKQCRLENVDILISEEDRAQHFAPYGDRVKLL
jgi:hypothetical protein